MVLLDLLMLAEPLGLLAGARHDAGTGEAGQHLRIAADELWRATSTWASATVAQLVEPAGSVEPAHPPMRGHQQGPA